MNSTFFLTDDILWDYADGFLDASQQQEVEKHLRLHPEWQTHLQAILDEKREMSSLPLETPKPGFADRVMAAWAAEHVTKTVQSKSNDWVVRCIALAFVLFILAPAILMIVAALRMPATQIPGIDLPQVSLPAVEWSALFGSSFLQIGFLLVFVFFALRLFEKMVLQRLVVQKLA
ncbi:MAG: anti-sigma factor family protein [Saprospiraceae bacterium]